MARYAVRFTWDNGCDGEKEKTWIHESELQGKDLILEVLKEEYWFSNQEGQDALREVLDSGTDETGDEIELTQEDGVIELSFNIDRGDYYCLGLDIKPCAPVFQEVEPEAFIGKMVTCRIGDEAIRAYVQSIDFETGRTVLVRTEQWSEIRDLQIVPRVS